MLHTYTYTYIYTETREIKANTGRHRGRSSIAGQLTVLPRIDIYRANCKRGRQLSARMVSLQTAAIAYAKGK